MIVKTYGTVTITSGQIIVEGWHIELDADDTPDATPEGLLLPFAVKWAQTKMQEQIDRETNRLVAAVLHAASQTKN